MTTSSLSLLRRWACAGAAVVALGAAPGCILYASPADDPNDPAYGQPAGEESVADFEEPLGAYGDWVDVPGRGRVWVPSEEAVGEDFTPYSSNGQWVSTDQGWVFQSQQDAEWGWATYHYGRWYRDDTYGWAWVPDTVWGPAWVDWRYGGDYVGWAPMAPWGIVLAPGAYAFVETRYIASPGVAVYRVPADRVGVVYHSTAASGEIQVRGGVRYSMGPPAAHVAAAGVSVRPVHMAAPAGIRRNPAYGRARARARGMGRRGKPRAYPSRGGGGRRR